MKDLAPIHDLHSFSYHSSFLTVTCFSPLKPSNPLLIGFGRMLFTLLTLVLVLSLRAACASIPAAQPQPQSPPSSTTPIPASASDFTDGLQTVNPVDMAQLCQQPAYYCIYVDQVRAGIVHASPVNATDRRKFPAGLPLFFPFLYPHSKALTSPHFPSDRGRLSIRAQIIPGSTLPRLFRRFLYRPRLQIPTRLCHDALPC